jgi:O-acetyl-ADP-ribose deacetylase (regulator of RNase III)
METKLLKKILSTLPESKLIDCVLNSRQINFVNGDILNATEDYIVQQVNATGNRNMGLASSIAKKYPLSNIYSGIHKVENRIPGTIIIRDKVINIVGQINPGKPSGKDSAINRITFFKNALNAIPKDLVSIAFPMGIGCGLAGGDWDVYLNLIKQFKINNPNTKVTIYKL